MDRAWIVAVVLALSACGPDAGNAPPPPSAKVTPLEAQFACAEAQMALERIAVDKEKRFEALRVADVCATRATEIDPDSKKAVALREAIQDRLNSLLPPVPPPPAWESDEAQARYRADTLAEGPGTCDDLPRIREISFRGTLGFDKYYDRIKVFPDHYRPCLVDALDDYTPLAEHVHLGPSMNLQDRSQLAHIMLVEADIIDFDLCQPPEVLAEKEIQGAPGFYYWLNESTAHRDQFTACLQRELGRPARRPRPD